MTTNHLPGISSQWADKRYRSDQLTVVGHDGGKVLYRWDGTVPICSKPLHKFLSVFEEVQAVLL